MVTRIAGGMLGAGAVKPAAIHDDDIPPLLAKLGLNTVLSRLAALEAVPAPASGIIHYQEFTANGTWNKPSGVLGTDIIRVEMIAGGDSGACARDDFFSELIIPSGGLYLMAEFKASDVPASVAVTVGQGGAAIVRSSGFHKVLPNPGTPTIFGTLIATNSNFKALAAVPAKFVYERSSAAAVNAGAFGGAFDTDGNPTVAAGTSVRGGNGGATVPTGTNATGGTGQIPGGAGGSVRGNGTVTSGAGARGYCRVTVIR